MKMRRVSCTSSHFFVSLIRTCVGQHPQTERKVEIKQELEEEDDDDDDTLEEGVYRVEAIMAKMAVNGELRYLVKWKNYDKKDWTWELCTQIKADVPEMVEAYERRQKAKAK
jgi:hypothetical protein